ncbi:MAG: hypothetical protein GF381_04475 [Candidatus Pacebacteria bacterium]|nr:hypothetical protein [Candidatus Paceibacterota bacterium]
MTSFLPNLIFNSAFTFSTSAISTAFSAFTFSASAISTAVSAFSGATPALVFGLSSPIKNLMPFGLADSHYLYFFLGLLGLWLGSELITKSATKIAKRMGLSETFIGLTILAIGTDFPEIMVAMTGAVDQLHGAETTGLVVGNIMGSVLSQISLILGLSGLFKVLRVRKEEVMKNGLVLIGATLMVLLLALDGFLSQVDGLILVAFYLAYFFSLQSKTGFSIIKGKVRRFTGNGMMLSLLKLGLGLLILAQASHWVVASGEAIATELGVSQMIVGVLLIGFGTSLPELVVSLSAILKGSTGLSVGNLIGSNLIDLLIALGGSAMIGGWQIDRRIATFDLAYLLLTSVIVVLFLMTRRKLDRKESLLVVSLYGVYVSLKILGF